MSETQKDNLIEPTNVINAEPVSATEGLSNAQKEALGKDLAELLISSLDGTSADPFQSFTGLAQQLKKKQDELDIMAADSLPASVITDYVSDVLLPNSNGDLISIIADDPGTQAVVSGIYSRLALPLEKIVYTLIKNGICIGEFQQVSSVSVASKTIASATESVDSAVEATYVRDPGTILPNVSILTDTYTVFPMLKYEKCIGYLQVKSSADVFSDFDWTTQDIDYKDVVLHPLTDFCYETFGVSPNSKPLRLRVSNKDDGTVTVYDVAQGHSILEDAYSAWRTLSLLQDSIVLASLIKNAQIMLVECEAGTATKQQIEAGKLKLRQLFEGQLAMGRQGIKSYLNPQSKPAFIYSFVSNGVGKITANLIGGEYNPGQLYYLTPFVNQFFAAMRSPKQSYGFTEGAGGLDGGGAVEQYTKRYTSTVRRLKRLLASFISRAINNVLMAKGMTKLVGAYTVKVHGAYDDTTQQEMQALQTRLSLYESVLAFTQVEDPDKQRELRGVMLKEIVTSPQVAKLLDELMAKTAPEPVPNEGADITGTQLSPEALDELGIGDGSSSLPDIELAEEPASEPAELPEMQEVLVENNE